MSASLSRLLAALYERNNLRPRTQLSSDVSLSRNRRVLSPPSVLPALRTLERRIPVSYVAPAAISTNEFNVLN